MHDFDWNHTRYESSSCTWFRLWRQWIQPIRIRQFKRYDRDQSEIFQKTKILEKRAAPEEIASNFPLIQIWFCYEDRWRKIEENWGQIRRGLNPKRRESKWNAKGVARLMSVLEKIYCLNCTLLSLYDQPKKSWQIKMEQKE